MESHGFPLISIVFHRFERFWGQGAWRPVPPCAALCHPVASCHAGLDPPNIKVSASGGLDLEPWMLVPGCWQDWNGLEEVTEVTAFWGEGIGRNSHTLKLQELGGSHGVGVHLCACIL